MQLLEWRFDLRRKGTADFEFDLLERVAYLSRGMEGTARWLSGINTRAERASAGGPEAWEGSNDKDASDVATLQLDAIALPEVLWQTTRFIQEAVILAAREGIDLGDWVESATRALTGTLYREAGDDPTQSDTELTPNTYATTI